MFLGKIFINSYIYLYYLYIWYQSHYRVTPSALMPHQVSERLSIYLIIWYHQPTSHTYPNICRFQENPLGKDWVLQGCMRGRQRCTNMQMPSLPYQVKNLLLIFFFKIVLMCVYFILRWVWNHGRTSGDYSMVSTWNTWKTSIVVYICFFWVSISASKVCWNWYTWQVGLLNVDGYYNSLLALFDKGVEEGFIDESERNIVVSAETVEELITKMEVDWIWFSWIKKHKNTITQFNIVSTYLLWVVF